MSEEKSTPRIQWHRLLGALLKELLSPVDISVQTDFSIMSQSPEGDILLLRREGDSWTEAQRNLLPDGVRDSLAGHNVLEFKYTESLNEGAIIQALAYDFFYKQANHLAEADVATFILSAKTPRRQVLEAWGYEQTEQTGVYRSKRSVFRLVTVLVLNELSNETHNVYVKCFASRNQAKQEAFKTIRQTASEKISWKLQTLIAGLWEIMRQGIWKGDKMAEELTPERVMEIGEMWGKAYLASLQPEERLAGLQPEERLAGLQPEDVLTFYKIEDIEAYLKKRKDAEASKTKVTSFVSPSFISEQKAIEIAQSACEQHQIKWQEPIKSRVTESHWLVEIDTINDEKFIIQIDKTTGDVLTINPHNEENNAEDNNT